MFRLALASTLATVEAQHVPLGSCFPGRLFITYEDCGAKHAHVDDLQPTALEGNHTLTSIGTVDEDVVSAHFTATVSLQGKQVSSCSGDGTTDIVCHLPSEGDSDGLFKGGEIIVKALSFPISKGTVGIPVELDWYAPSRPCGPIWPAGMGHIDVHIEADEHNGESFICLDVHTSEEGHCCFGGSSCETTQACHPPNPLMHGCDDGLGGCEEFCGGVWCPADFTPPSNASTPGPVTTAALEPAISESTTVVV
jgi:hypothetical protein